MAERDRLTGAALDAIETAERLHVSVASAWEISLKVSRGKLALQGGLEATLTELRSSEELNLIDLTLDDVLELGRLPDTEHRDPFDRILAAQARARGLIVLSADRQFDGLGVTRVW